MPKYYDWEFLLDGDTQEFRNLVYQPGTILFNLYGGVDDWNDCPNDDFRLSTLYCDGETDINVVWEVGNELISLFNGASVLYKRDYKKASICNLLHNGALCASSEIKHEYHMRPAPLGTPKCSDDILEKLEDQAKKLSKKLRLLYLATINNDVYCILKYLAMEENWVNYFNLVETIETFSGTYPVHPFSKTKRDTFRRNAGTFSVSGFDSRHGFKDIAKEAPPKTMLISEAYNLVVSAAEHYLQEKYFR